MGFRRRLASLAAILTLALTSAGTTIDGTETAVTTRGLVLDGIGRTLDAI